MRNLIKIGFKKVAHGLLVVVAIAVLNAIITSYIINENKKAITKMTNVINPYVEALEEFNLLVTESKMYATNWVYLQSSIKDKDNLMELHDKKYPLIKRKLSRCLEQVNNVSESENLAEVFKQFEQLLLIEKSIMGNLASFDDYENPSKKFMAEDIIETEVLPRTESIQTQLKEIVKYNHDNAEQVKNDMVASFNQLISVVMTVSIGLFVVVLLASWFISNSIRVPVLKMKEIVSLLGRGELPEGKLKVSDDVIGEMISSVNALSENFAKTTVFANEIGRGHLSAEFTPLSEKDTLGNALIDMRNSLKVYSEDLEGKVRERTREVSEKSEKLEIAYSEIRDSINYAKRIQEAILPSRNLISSVFKQSFIFYKPKDIVSGDFYWFAEKGNQAFIAAVDCTGHGVPGALMTVIGNSLLNQVVNITDVMEPAEILTQLDIKVRETLKQHGQENTNDGMDVALCRYDIAKNEITFSGAKLSMYLFSDKKLIELKG